MALEMSLVCISSGLDSPCSVSQILWNAFSLWIFEVDMLFWNLISLGIEWMGECGEFPISAEFSSENHQDNDYKWGMAKVMA